MDAEPWWADVLGYQVRPHTEEDIERLRRDGIDRPEDDPNIAVDPDDESGPSFWFCRVREGNIYLDRVGGDTTT